MNKLFLDAKRISIVPDGNEHIKVKFPDGTEIGSVHLKRLFPLSSKWLFIRLSDENENELGIIRNLEELAPTSRKTAVRTLEHFYIIPRITEIYNLYDSHGSLLWDVETDRGRRDFQVRSRDKDMLIFPTGRILLRDSNNNQYEIHDHNKLARHSRKLLESWL